MMKHSLIFDLYYSVEDFFTLLITISQPPDLVSSPLSVRRSLLSHLEAFPSVLVQEIRRFGESNHINAS